MLEEMLTRQKLKELIESKALSIIRIKILVMKKLPQTLRELQEHMKF